MDIKTFLQENNPCSWFVVKNNITHLVEAVQRADITENMVIDIRGMKKILFSMLDSEFEKFKDTHLLANPDISNKTFLRYNCYSLEYQLEYLPKSVEYFQNIILRKLGQPVSTISFLQEIIDRNLTKIIPSPTEFVEDKFAFTTSMIKKYQGIPEITETQILGFLKDTKDENIYQNIKKELNELRKTLYYKIKNIDENMPIEERNTVLPIDILFARSKDSQTGNYLNYLYQLQNIDGYIIDDSNPYRPNIKNIIFKEIEFCIDKFFRYNPYKFVLPGIQVEKNIKENSLASGCLLAIYNSFLNISNNIKSNGILKYDLIGILLNGITLYHELPANKINDIWRNRFTQFKNFIGDINVDELTSLNQFAVASALKKLDQKIYGEHSLQNYYISQFLTKIEFIRVFNKFLPKFASQKAIYKTEIYNAAPPLVLEWFQDEFAKANCQQPIFHFMFSVSSDFFTHNQNIFEYLFEKMRKQAEYSTTSLLVMEKHAKNTDIHFFYCNIDQRKHKQKYSHLGYLYNCKIFNKLRIDHNIPIMINSSIPHNLNEYLSTIKNIDQITKQKKNKL